MSDFLVSVCMITYNHEGFIYKALSGIVQQDFFFPIEVVIVDDSSTDNTVEYIENFILSGEYNRSLFFFNFVKNRINLGVRRNFLFALSLCRGKYVALCEGDDFWVNPKKIFRQIDCLESDNRLIACFHNALIVNQYSEESGSFYFNLNWRHNSIIPKSFFIMELGASFPTCSMVFKNNNLFYFPEDEKIYGGDNLLILNLIRFGDIYYFNEAWSAYRVHPNGTFSSYLFNRRKQENIFISHVFLLEKFESMFLSDKAAFKVSKSKYSRLIFFEGDKSFLKIKYLLKLNRNDWIDLINILLKKMNIFHE